MGNYVLSRKADADIQAIAAFSLQRWDLARAEKYVLGLHETFRMLVEFPDLGRDASQVRGGYRKVETANHVVFYRKTVSGILIVRILHRQMDVDQHI